jgi:hypothetical protein
VASPSIVASKLPENIGDVENVEGLYLDTVNAFFGTDFVESQIAGR